MSRHLTELTAFTDEDGFSIYEFPSRKLAKSLHSNVQVLIDPGVTREQAAEILEHCAIRLRERLQPLHTDFRSVRELLMQIGGAA